MIFFVYPDPRGSEENQFTPPGEGVNKLIFEPGESYIYFSNLKSEIKQLTS